MIDRLVQQWAESQERLGLDGHREHPTIAEPFAPIDRVSREIVRPGLSNAIELLGRR
jgi:hypothetical protein